MQLPCRSASWRPPAWVGLLCLCAWLVACQSPPEKPASEPATEALASDVLDGSFSRDRAWQHLLALTDIGPRVAGTEGAARARDYIRRHLEGLGYEVVERRSQVFVEARGETVELVHVTGLLAGASPDAFMLAASYDTPPVQEGFEFVGANESASGAALLLELARVLVSRPLPYTAALTFLDGEELPKAAADGEPALLGSRDLARQLAEEGSLEKLRLVVFFHQVADPDLAIARDLRSNRAYREVFWRAARSLGYDAAFPGDGGFETPSLGHLSFLDRGVRTVVAVTDNHFGGAYAPGTYWRTDRDTPEHCSPHSLEVVAVVTLEALEQIGARLKKIDSFVRRPLERPSRGALGGETREATGGSAAGDRELETQQQSDPQPAPAGLQPPASP